MNNNETQCIIVDDITIDEEALIKIDDLLLEGKIIIQKFLVFLIHTELIILVAFKNLAGKSIYIFI